MGSAVAPRTPRHLPYAARLAAISIFASISAVQAQDKPYVVPAPENLTESLDRSRAVTCLATAIAYEAGYEPVAGQQAVAEVVLNRLHHPAFPKTVCGVIFAGSERRTGCQFSFTCDGSLRRPMPASILTATRAIAIAAIDNRNPLRVAGATHYHADYVSPYWAPSLVRVGKIGAHIFYRGAGARDLPNGGYAPHGEPAISALDVTAQTVTAAAANRAPIAAPLLAFAPWGVASSQGSK